MSRYRRAAYLVAALGTAAATIGIGGSPAHATTAPTHVAIVVDFRNGDVQTACVRSGSDGAAVLAARFQVQYNRVGLVAIIDGVGSMSPPRDLYWSYWHGAAGSWSYASTGPGTFHPAAGTVEGWAYDDGNSGPRATPSYATICAGQDAGPAPRPPPSTPPISRPASAPHPAPDRPGNTATPQAGTTGSTAAQVPVASGSSPPASGPAPPNARAGRAMIDAANGSASPSDAPSASTDAPARSSSHASLAPALGTSLALLTAAAIGGIAFWRLRRARQD